MQYTTYGGQIVYSLTNNSYNATQNTNLIAPDAFKLVSLAPLANGDFAANAAVVLYIGNTNWIPVAVTNSFGQYFVTNWVLASSQYPNWMYPATTNVYPTYGLTATNVVTVTLYRLGLQYPQGGVASATLQKSVNIPETAGAFSFSVNATGITNLCVITNLPSGWLVGARQVYATVSANATTGGSGVLLNQLGIVQPQ